MAEQKFRYALITRYKKHVKMKGLPDQNINMYAEQYVSDAIIESYGLDECYNMVEYYVGVSSNPSWKWFARNADKVYDAMKAKIRDDEERKILREQAKEWLSR